MMTTLTKVRRSFAAALMFFLIITATPALMAADASTSTDTASRKVAREVCDYDWKRSTYQLKRLIRCAARRWRVHGGPDKAVSVARCESRFNPNAYNPGGYAGVFQQATRYWRSRATTYGFRDSSVYNGRANIVVSVRMAHRSGWGAWSCA
jgi:hypothetical protein